MRAVRIPGADPVPLGAPPDWNEKESGHCGGLFVRRENIAGVGYMRSAWEVEATEAAALFAGARLTLGVAGPGHPVVQLGVGDLPPDFEPTVMARRFNQIDGRPFVKVEMMFPHGGGRRGFCEVHVDGTLADAVSHGVTRIETLARREGWIE